MNNDDLTRKPDGRYPKWELLAWPISGGMLLGILLHIFFGAWSAFVWAALAGGLFCLGAWMDGRK